MVLCCHGFRKDPSAVLIGQLGQDQTAIGLRGGYRRPAGQQAASAGESLDSFGLSKPPPSPTYSKTALLGETSPTLLGVLGNFLKGVAGSTSPPLPIPGPTAAAVALTLASLNEQASKQELESKDALVGALGKTTELMSASSGIVDLPKGVPTLVIPDMHAQRDYLLRALQHEVDGQKVFDLLKQGKMNLLLLGDGMHSEERGADRWLMAERDYLDGRKDSAAMRDEVLESFGTMKMVMDLKTELGDHLVYLRGNHDDIEGGFRKYCDTVGESKLMSSWVGDHYGPDFVKSWAAFEDAMPLVARGTGFVASHAAPAAKMRRKDIEKRQEQARTILTWSDNTQWRDESSQKAIFYGNLEAVGGQPTDRWLIGHRKVTGRNYRSQFDQQLIQINPTSQEGFVVAMIGADGAFDPERDTFKV
jgi:hypothetical protein